MSSLLDLTIAALTAAGFASCTPATWGTAPLYVEQGRGKPARISRTPGKVADLLAALVALRAAGRTASIRDERITVSA